MQAKSVCVTKVDTSDKLPSLLVNLSGKFHKEMSKDLFLFKSYYTLGSKSYSS